MKKVIIVVSAACAMLIVAGCKTRVPNVDYYKGPSQKRFASVQHWDAMSKEVSASIYQNNALTPPPVIATPAPISPTNGEIILLQPPIAKPDVATRKTLAVMATENTEFSKCFVKLLEGEFVSKGVGIASTNDANLICRVETYVVKHDEVGPSRSFFGCLPRAATTFWTRIAYDTKFCIVGGEYGDPRCRTEMLVLTSLFDGEKPLSVVKQIVYLGENDEARLYSPNDASFQIKSL